MVKACKTEDKEKFVAIKKIKRVFDHTVFAHRAMRELRILRCLTGHENILRIHDIVLPKDPKSFSELYVVTDYM